MSISGSMSYSNCNVDGGLWLKSVAFIFNTNKMIKFAMLNLPWVEVIAVTMSLLHLYWTNERPYKHGLSHSCQSPLISLAHLCPIIASRWERPDIKEKYFIKTLPPSHLLSSNLPLLWTAFYLGWRMLAAMFIDCIILFLNFSMVISVTFCKHKQSWHSHYNFADRDDSGGERLWYVECISNACMTQ